LGSIIEGSRGARDMTNLRYLTPNGIKKFEQFITNLRQNNSELFELSELDHSPWSSEFEPEIEVEQKIFTTRTEMGQYLVELFIKADIKIEELIYNKSLWSWLAAYWFNSICPKQKDGTRKVRETARYLCSLDWRDYYRHLVSATWFTYMQHGKNSRLCLHSPPYVHNDFMEQLASKQSIVSGKSIFEVADKLYWDIQTRRPKINASNRNFPGNLRRFISVIWQLELTYDVYSISAEKIIELLPVEFVQWKA
jgi:hypothetical protein